MLGSICMQAGRAGGGVPSRAISSGGWCASFRQVMSALFDVTCRPSSACIATTPVKYSSVFWWELRGGWVQARKVSGRLSGISFAAGAAHAGAETIQHRRPAVCRSRCTCADHMALIHCRQC